jgi:hypothetical protein
VEVRHGTLLNVFGKPAKHAGYTFMPAYVELDETSFSHDYRLSDHVSGREAPALRFPVEHGFDAAWVRARIPSVFGFTPEKAEVEKALLYVGLVAVPEGEAVCYPFICTDHYGRSALMFSDDGPEEAVKRSIAAGFWGLLMQNSEDVTDFVERVNGPMGWLNYGCEAGRVYCEESLE